MYQNYGQLGPPGRAYAGSGLGVEELCVSDLRVGSLAFWDSRHSEPSELASIFWDFGCMVAFVSPKFGIHDYT